jgi:excisionase family DNA binding protein
MRENGGRGPEPRQSADERRPPHALAEPLLDTSAAARLLSVRPSWIYEAVRAGRIPHLKIGRHIRFLRSDLEDWVVSRRVRENAASRIRRP